MRLNQVLLALIQVTLAGCAVLLSVWASMTWPALAGICLVGLGAIIRQLGRSMPVLPGTSWWRRVSQAGVLLIALGLLLNPAQLRTWDVYFAFVPWLLAIGLLLAAWSCRESDERQWWRALALLLAFGGDLPLLVTSYLQNLGAAFHAGLLLALFLLVLGKAWLPLRGWGIQAANTLILLVIGLPLADFLVSPAAHLGEIPKLSERPWSYEFAKRDPAGYARWWQYYMSEGPGLYRQIFVPDPDGVIAFYLKPNSRARFCQSDVVVNSLGFRGREIAVEKGNKYRIGALGESTTWGATVGPLDRPWPEALEEFISLRLHPIRPVEVINAGVPSINLRENLHRLEKQILPLKPDLIISYHGYNGFPWLDTALPPVRSTQPPPKYRPRPLKLLADCEYAARMRHYQRAVLAVHDFSAATPIDPLATEYATHYRRLIEMTRTNGIRLVLATYSMAVNANSDREVAGFYQHIIPSLQRQVKACEVHNALVIELARQHPEIIFVDTRPVLNGHHEYFIDLMHFTQAGREQMAEMFFAAIKPALEADQLLPTETTIPVRDGAR